MDGVSSAPVIVRGKGKYPDDPADPVVHAAPGVQVSMAAIMLQDEKPDQKPCRRDRQDQSEPVAV